MFVTWRGFGLAVAPIAAAAVVGAIATTVKLKSSGLEPVLAVRVAWLGAMLVGAILIWAFAMHMAGKPRKRVNPKTGHEYLSRDHAFAGHFCFIPTRYWALILLTLGITVAVAPQLFL